MPQQFLVKHFLFIEPALCSCRGKHQVAVLSVSLPLESIVSAVVAMSIS